MNNVTAYRCGLLDYLRGRRSLAAVLKAAEATTLLYSYVTGWLRGAWLLGIRADDV